MGHSYTVYQGIHHEGSNAALYVVVPTNVVLNLSLSLNKCCKCNTCPYTIVLYSYLSRVIAVSVSTLAATVT